MKTIYTHSGIGHLDDILGVSMIYEDGDRVIKINNRGDIKPKAGDVFIDCQPPVGVDSVNLDGVVVLDHHKEANETECSFVKVLKHIGIWDDILWQDKTVKAVNDSDLGISHFSNRYMYGLFEIGLKDWWTKRVEFRDEDYIIIKMIGKIFREFIVNKVRDMLEADGIIKRMRVDNELKIAYFDVVVNLGLITDKPEMRDIVYVVMPNSQNIQQTGIIALNGKGGDPMVVYNRYFSNRKIVFKHSTGFMVVIE